MQIIMSVWLAGVVSGALSIRNMLSLLVVNSGLHSGFPDSLLSVDFCFHPFPCGIKINGVVWKLKAWVRQFITASAVQQQRHSNEWGALISLEIYGNQMVVWANHSTEKQPVRFYLALYGWYWIFFLFKSTSCIKGQLLLMLSDTTCWLFIQRVQFILRASPSTYRVQGLIIIECFDIWAFLLKVLPRTLQTNTLTSIHSPRVVFHGL